MTAPSVKTLCFAAELTAALSADAVASRANYAPCHGAASCVGCGQPVQPDVSCARLDVDCDPHAACFVQLLHAVVFDGADVADVAMRRSQRVLRQTQTLVSSSQRLAVKKYIVAWYRPTLKNR